MSSADEGTLLPPGAELRVRVATQTLLKATLLMSGAARDRPAALGPAMLVIEAVVPEDAVPHLLVSCDTGEMTLSRVIEGIEILESGSISVVLPEFLTKLKHANEAKVELSVLDTEKILLRTSRTRWEVSGRVGDTSKALGEVKKISQLQAADLAAAIEGVLPAVPSKGGRPTLERIHISKGWAVATDGALLLKRHVGEGNFFDLDIPRAAAGIIATRKSGPVGVYRLKNSTLLRYDSVELVLHDAAIKYPDVSKIEQAAHLEDHGLLVADVDDLKAALAATRAYSSPEDPEVRLRSIKAKVGWLTVMLSSDRGGNLSKAATSSSWQDDKQLNAIFHEKHLAALLKAHGAGEIEMRIALKGKTLLVEDLDRGLVAVLQQLVS